MEPFILKYLSSIVDELVYIVAIPQYCSFMTSEEVLVFPLIDPYSSFISKTSSADFIFISIYQLHFKWLEPFFHISYH